MALGDTAKHIKLHITDVSPLNLLQLQARALNSGTGEPFYMTMMALL